MKRFFIKQSLVLPLIAMLVPMFMGLAVHGYSSVSQQMSEMELLNSPAAEATRIAAFVSGASIVSFGLTLLVTAFRQYKFTGMAAVLFGASMISNGVFLMGGPLHGLYGIGLFVVLVPAFFAAEFEPAADRWNVRIRTVSMLVAVYNLLYMWLMIARLDPVGFQGLTQRISTFFFFGWYSFASYALLRSGFAESEKSEWTGKPAELRKSPLVS